MRIISGSGKGRKLYTPRTPEIRPTSDKAREAIFSILTDKLAGAIVLDLFSGTGALGIEALSRNARYCIFVDKGRQALKITDKNIKLLPDIEKRSTIIKHDLSKSLPLKHLLSLAPEGFDLIFADPPYSKGLSKKILQSLSVSAIVHTETIIIIEERSSETLKKQTETLELMDKRKYGEAAFWLYRLKRNNIYSKQL